MTHRAGVIGKDISYSLSPRIHKLFSQASGINLDYEIHDIDKDPIPFIYDFFKKGGTGLNITKPYKEIVAKEFSKSLDSVNCLYGEIDATSTDGSGFIADIKSKNISLNDSNILLFGLGGAGKSILKEIKTTKNIYVENRTKAKVEAVIQKNENIRKYSGEPVDLFISCAEKFDLESITFIQNINNIN